MQARLLSSATEGSDQTPFSWRSKQSMLLIVLCNFSVPFGKLFPKINSNYFGSKTLDNDSIGITALTATPEEKEVALCTAAVKEKSKFCLFARREIDDYGLNPYEFCIYARITCRVGNGEAWESITNMASACRIVLSQARKALRPLNLAEITQ